MKVYVIDGWTCPLCHESNWPWTQRCGACTRWRPLDNDGTNDA